MTKLILASSSIYRQQILRKYYSEFGDLVANICANALDINIMIIMKDGSDKLSYHYIPHSDACATACIMKIGCHYDGLVVARPVSDDEAGNGMFPCSA